MATPCRYVFLMILAACCAAAFAQPPGKQTELLSSGLASGPAAAPARSEVVRQAAPTVVGPRVGFFRSYGIGTYGSSLGFGGRIAASITPWINLRVGASFFSFSTTRRSGTVPFKANIRMQAEEAQLDWYPFHGGFHISPGVMFGGSNRAYGSAVIPPNNSLTLNGTTYYSGASDPLHASGSVRFGRTAPMLTVGWGNWARPERQRHWVFPFEMGAVFWGDPKTALNFSGVACTDPSQRFCHDAATDPTVQSNIDAERKKLQNGANWLKIYPIIAGGIVYRF